MTTTTEDIVLSVCRVAEVPKRKSCRYQVPGCFRCVQTRRCVQSVHGTTVTTVGEASQTLFPLTSDLPQSVSMLKIATLRGDEEFVLSGGMAALQVLIDVAEGELEVMRGRHRSGVDPQQGSLMLTGGSCGMDEDRPRLSVTDSISQLLVLLDEAWLLVAKMIHIVSLSSLGDGWVGLLARVVRRFSATNASTSTEAPPMRETAATLIAITKYMAMHRDARTNPTQPLSLLRQRVQLELYNALSEAGILMPDADVPHTVDADAARAASQGRMCIQTAAHTSRLHAAMLHLCSDAALNGALATVSKTAVEMPTEYLHSRQIAELAVTIPSDVSGLWLSEMQHLQSPSGDSLIDSTRGFIFGVLACCPLTFRIEWDVNTVEVIRSTLFEAITSHRNAPRLHSSRIIESLCVILADGTTAASTASLPPPSTSAVPTPNPAHHHHNGHDDVPIVFDISGVCIEVSPTASHFHQHCGSGGEDALQEEDYDGCPTSSSDLFTKDNDIERCISRLWRGHAISPSGISRLQQEVLYLFGEYFNVSSPCMVMALSTSPFLLPVLRCVVETDILGCIPASTTTPLPTPPITHSERLAAFYTVLRDRVVSTAATTTTTSTEYAESSTTSFPQPIDWGSVSTTTTLWNTPLPPSSRVLCQLQGLYDAVTYEEGSYDHLTQSLLDGREAAGGGTLSSNAMSADHSDGDFVDVGRHGDASSDSIRRAYGMVPPTTTTRILYGLCAEVLALSIEVVMYSTIGPRPQLLLNDDAQALMFTINSLLETRRDGSCLQMAFTPMMAGGGAGGAGGGARPFVFTGGADRVRDTPTATTTHHTSNSFSPLRFGISLDTLAQGYLAGSPLESSLSLVRSRMAAAMGRPISYSLRNIDDTESSNNGGGGRSVGGGKVPTTAMVGLFLHPSVPHVEQDALASYFHSSLSSRFRSLLCVEDVAYMMARVVATAGTRGASSGGSPGDIQAACDRRLGRELVEFQGVFPQARRSSYVLQVLVDMWRREKGYYFPDGTLMEAFRTHLQLPWRPLPPHLTFMYEPKFDEAMRLAALALVARRGVPYDVVIYIIMGEYVAPVYTESAAREWLGKKGCSIA